MAALERFMRATAAAPTAAGRREDPWRRAAILEGVMREGDWGDPHAWINT